MFDIHLQPKPCVPTSQETGTRCRVCKSNISSSAELSFQCPLCGMHIHDSCSEALASAGLSDAAIAKFITRHACLLTGLRDCLPQSCAHAWWDAMTRQSRTVSSGSGHASASASSSSSAFQYHTQLLCICRQWVFMSHERAIAHFAHVQYMIRRLQHSVIFCRPHIDVAKSKAKHSASARAVSPL